MIFHDRLSDKKFNFKTYSDFLELSKIEEIFSDLNFCKFVIFTETSNGERSLIACYHKDGDPINHFYAQIVVGTLINVTNDVLDEIKKIEKVNLYLTL